ncbi:hypothetical protein B0G71_6949 [Paraburkholderia sp. BL27I4N3]|nr:hypothetical protein B0G71_6949 [Paraburkholderia sp. BL27I4N3]RKR37777.1 hypothetical protein B0G82_5887 [Paraburkholderia sp. BL17N1]
MVKLIGFTQRMEIVQRFGKEGGKCVAGSADRVGFEGCYSGDLRGTAGRLTSRPCAVFIRVSRDATVEPASLGLPKPVLRRPLLYKI